jgi:hypothetical protein
MVFFCLTPALSDLLTAKASEGRVDRAMVEKLVRQLGHPSFTMRDAAEKALLEQGTPALPLLVDARAQGDYEIRRRLDTLIPSLQSASLLAPRRVTLPAHKSAKEYAALIGAQTNYVIVADGLDARQRFNMSCSRAPFWETLDKLCDSAGCSFAQNLNEDAIRLVIQNGESPYRSYDGIFRVSALGFQYSRHTNFATLPKHNIAAAQPANESLVLNLLVQVEPKTPMLRAGRVKVTLALDDENRSMTSANDAQGVFMDGGSYYGNGLNRSHAMPVTTGLVLPGRSSRIVKRIKGVVPVTLLAEQKPLLVTDALMKSKGKKFKAGDATFQIDDVETTGGNIKQYGFKITYNENTTETRYDYSKVQSLQQRLELRDARGVKIASYPNFLQFNSATSAQLVLKTQGSSDKDAPVPAQLYYISWVQLDHDVAFDLKDLPLP